MRPRTIISVITFVFFTVVSLKANDRQYNPTYGPTSVNIITANAILQLPDGYFYLEKSDAIALLREVGNPGVDVDALIAPTIKNANWFIYFKFLDIGYFKMKMSKTNLRTLIYLAR
jgi:uncharacterized membrane-anchored protein